MATIYVTKKFTDGTLKGLTYNTAMPFTTDAQAAAFVAKHRKLPVKGNGSPWIIADASFQKYWRY